MKKIIRMFVALTILLAAIGYSNTHHKTLVTYPTTNDVPVLQSYPTIIHAAVKTHKIHIPVINIRGGIHDFMVAIGKYESHNNPQVVSSRGFLGKFQFSPRTLRLLNPSITSDSFLANEQLQDSIMLVYMRQNSSMLRTEIAQYSNKWINGTYVTKSGIVAASHLAGVGGVKSFFSGDGRYPTSDANGATVSMYMSKFANYNLGRN